MLKEFESYINFRQKRKLNYEFIGELAALSTSFFFAMTALIFTATGRMVGSQVANRLRLLFALLYLVILNLILFREPLPFSAESSRWMGTLLLSLAPIFGSIIAWIFFGESLTFWQIAGIVLALTGIAWVVLSHEEPPNTPHGHTRRGVLFGILAGLGQAIGLVFSKQGMFGDFSPFQANAIRMLAAVIFIWVWTIMEGKTGATIAALREKPRAIPLIAIGAVMGPLFGVSASLLAVQHAEVGVTSTLMAYTKSHTFFC